MSHSGWADTGLGVRWYGERGVLNALVAHMQRSHDSVESVRALLRAVRWADPQARLWLDTFTRATVLVEIGLADFGNPDLMIVCDGWEGVHCVFVEAKVTTYLASVRPNHRGMTLPGFNSSINGQLSLKYRFLRNPPLAGRQADQLRHRPGDLPRFPRETVFSVTPS